MFVQYSRDGGLTQYFFLKARLGAYCAMTRLPPATTKEMAISTLIPPNHAVTCCASLPLVVDRAFDSQDMSLKYRTASIATF
jgi:hypothetical protein